MAIIEIEGLAKSYRVYQKQEGLLASVSGLFHRAYREVSAVRGIDLKVDAGEFVAFLGPNGAGKTTTLKLLSGVISPSGGTARVMGYVPWKRENAYRRRFALVMGQKNQLWWDLPAQESFRLHQQIYGIEPAQFDRRRDELVDLLQVRPMLGQPVRELSLGERMKMELIAALLHSPEVLFLDEPTIGLDVVSKQRLREFLLAEQAEHGTTLLLTTHDMGDVQRLCPRVLVVDHGRLAYDGSLDGLSRLDGARRVLVVDLDEPAPDLVDVPHTTHLGSEANGLRQRLAVDSDATTVAAVLAAVTDRVGVRDLAVEEPDVEDVVRRVYSAQRERR